MEEEIKRKWQKSYGEFETAKNKYVDYVEQFFTQTINGEIIQEAKKSFSHEAAEEIIGLRREIDRTAKIFWDFAYSITFPKA